MDAAGSVDAAVLVPIYGWPADPGLIFTERRHDLRRHAGEISFPGGRSEEGESYFETALREAEEEIGLDRSRVEVVGALPPIGTFVTNYKVHPIVGLIGAGAGIRSESGRGRDRARVRPRPSCASGFAMRRLVRRGIPIRTPTYVVAEHLIWGATARILGELIARLPGHD